VGVVGVVVVVVVVVVVPVVVAVVVAPDTFGPAANAAGPVRATLMMTGTATAVPASADFRKVRRLLSMPSSGSISGVGLLMFLAHFASKGGRSQGRFESQSTEPHLAPSLTKTIAYWDGVFGYFFVFTWGF
jgi:hypothetical protein